MSHNRHFDWHTVALTVIAIIGIGYFLYLLKPVLESSQTDIAVAKKKFSKESQTVKTAYYDEQCTINIVHDDNTIVTIPTDLRITAPSHTCDQTKWLIISVDNKYVAFEGSKWDSTGYAPGNYLGIYFAHEKQYATWNFGSAQVHKPSLSPEGILSFQAVYEENPPVSVEKISLPFIESHFDEAVDPRTKEIRLISGVKQ